MNPNEINQNPNGTASQVNTGVSSSTVNTVPVQQPAPQVATPVAPVAPAAPQEVVPTPVASPVAPTPVVQEVTPAPIAPQVAPSPAPTPTPIPTTPVTPAATPMPTDPNAQIKPVNMSGVTQTQELPPQTTTEEPTVITTKKKRGSNIVLVLVIAILIVFAFNIDKALEYYENYLETGSLTKTDVSTDSLTNGFILINEATSNIKVNNIKFRNFKKGSNMTISFNYESPEKYDNPESLGIYIELYNSSKVIVYKELFNPANGIDKNTTVNYSMSLESDVYEKAYYALVKTYTDSEKNATSTLTCSLTSTKNKYENKYSFTNNSLEKYDVTIESLVEDKTEIEAEYEKVKDILSASYENNVLKYNVDLNTEIENYNPEYKKGLTPEIVKNRLELKKWTCE